MTVEYRPTSDNQASKPQPPLKPPGAGPAAGTGGAGVRYALAAVFVALALLVLLVVLVLPDWVAAPQQAAPVGGARPSTESVAAPGVERRAAEEALRQALQEQAALKRQRAPVWAAADWQQAATRLADGDRLFGERRFGDARRVYQDALALLRTLEESRPQRLQQALSAGQAALAGDRVADAIAGFEQALQIEPGHVEAGAGLARARVRDRVLELVQTAQAAETAGDTELAAGALRQALALDADYQAAQTALRRVEQQAATAAFDKAIDDALRALDQGKLTAAAQALDRAAQQDAQHPALRDARRRLAAAQRRSQLTRLRQQAQRASAAENWNAAVKTYRRALAIDANAGFAQQGLELAEQRAAVNRQFDHYLTEPTRLYSAEPLHNAERLLTEVTEVPANEPGLRDKRRRLAEAVAAARRPLSLRLRSDGLTDVVIYHVGRLGSFTEHSLELKPGTYTAVGSRPGYRDVRRVFTLTPGQPAVTIEIRCREPI